MISSIVLDKKQINDILENLQYLYCMFDDEDFCTNRDYQQLIFDQISFTLKDLSTDESEYREMKKIVFGSADF